MEWDYLLLYSQYSESAHSKTLSARIVKRALNATDADALALVLQHGSAEAAICAGLEAEMQSLGEFRQAADARFLEMKRALAVGPNQQYLTRA